MGQYLENTGSAPVRFLAAFKSSYRMSMTRPELVIVHLELLTSDGTLLKTKGSRGFLDSAASNAIPPLICLRRVPGSRFIKRSTSFHDFT